MTDFAHSSPSGSALSLSAQQDAAITTNNTSTTRRVRPEERAYQSEMMFLGEQCHLVECNRESFLPFRCPDCQNQWVVWSDHTSRITVIDILLLFLRRFCSDHYKTTDHGCRQASASFLVPLCPLCHEPPKNWRRDEDPNIAMNAHLTPNSRTGQSDCTALNESGRVVEAKRASRRVKKDKECREVRCRKLMVVPIRVGVEAEREGRQRN